MAVAVLSDAPGWILINWEFIAIWFDQNSHRAGGYEGSAWHNFGITIFFPKDFTSVYLYHKKTLSKFCKILLKCSFESMLWIALNSSKMCAVTLMATMFKCHCHMVTQVVAHVYIRYLCDTFNSLWTNYQRKDQSQSFDLCYFCCCHRYEGVLSCM